MIRFFIYIFALYLLLKKLYYVFINYKEYYTINKLHLDLVKVKSNKDKKKA